MAEMAYCADCKYEYTCILLKDKKGCLLKVTGEKIKPAKEGQ